MLFYCECNEEVFVLGLRRLLAMKKVGIIGHYGFGLNLANGQTIKTKIVTEEVEKSVGEENVLRIDAHGGVKAVIPVILGSWKCLKICSNTILMLTENGVKVAVPVLVLLNRIFRRKLHYVVVGGWLPEFLSNRKTLSSNLSKFNALYVETNNMKSKLEAQGFSNVLVMPNCKNLVILDEADLNYSIKKPFKLCTFSRVMKEKGIEDVVNAVKILNASIDGVVVNLDIYGQIDSNQIEWFDELKKKFSDEINYCGLVPFDKSVDVLQNYYALIFPTYYIGEGFAGTAIDAFASGIPVVASDWRYNSEVVNDGNGILFAPKNVDDLVAKIRMIVDCPEAWNARKINCLKTAHDYDPHIVMSTLIKRLV